MTISTWYPNSHIISNITNNNPGVVTTTQPHNYLSGLFVRIFFPANLGMTQVNNQVYEILVLDELNFAINVDTSKFDVFSPSTELQSPQVIPVAEVASTLLMAEQNTLIPIGG